jgi:glycosyltransferase involved in cell wall biosynthesis
MRILQINATVNSGSTGRIAEDIGKVLINNEHESYIAAHRTTGQSTSEVIPIGSKIDRYSHALLSRAFDRHGFGSAKATRELVKKIHSVDPDIIHLHNIHGYYLNIKVLFDFLKKVRLPVVWTFHDCWPFTGHCSYFDAVNCFRWKAECHHCPNIKAYPASWGLDQSRRNFHEKNKIFNDINDLLIITPSKWLAEHVSNSYLGNYPVHVINNGIDISMFRPSQHINKIKEKWELNDKKIILGVASVWDSRKGMKDFIQLRQVLSRDIEIVLVGLNSKDKKSLPAGITGISRTENIQELADLYSASNAFINPTYVDNFPTTNIESLACGTPVITYDTGGSPEAIDNETGIVIDKGDIDGLAGAIHRIIENGKESYIAKCRNRAEGKYNKDDRFIDYLRIYESMLDKS